VHPLYEKQKIQHVPRRSNGTYGGLENSRLKNMSDTDKKEMNRKSGVVSVKK
jgi:hypothetical protein